jgi:hypothetical protein
MRREVEQHWPEPAEDARESPDQRIVIAVDRLRRLPTGMVYITNVVGLPTRNPRVTQYTLTLQGGPDWPANQTTVQTINERIADAAERAWHTQTPVEVATRRTRYGYDVAAIGAVAAPVGAQSDMTPAQRNCRHHRWDRVTERVMKCRFCGFLWRAER